VTDAITTCPFCGADVVSRERRPDGVHRCANGHLFTPSQVLTFREPTTRKPTTKGPAK
jgi:hypothetical protein